jgi:crotonobetainyl-CoA:carnitine CoA-transferase CaiB-like acyl-CoA transferase
VTDSRACLPLHGVTVLDFTRMIAGPKTSMILSDLGADVIKVESPGQEDPSRYSGDNPGIMHTMSNRNKRSLVIDLTKTEGRELARKLALQSDVVIESNRPGMMAKFGLSYKQLQGDAPRLIYASLSGYGSQGPDAARGSVDTIIQAETGLMLNTGAEGDPPVLLGGYIIDETAGLALSQNIILALYNREKTGIGCHVEVSLMDAALYLQSYEIAFSSLTGTQPARTGNKLPLTAPAGVVEAKDGPMIIFTITDESYRSLCSIVERPDLIEDKRFTDRDSRIAHHEHLLNELSSAMKTKTRAEWQEKFLAAKLLAGPVRTYDEVINEPQLEASGSLVDGTHRGEPLKLVRWPGHFAGRRYPERVGTSPSLGEHTTQILSEFGYSQAETELMISSGVVVANG